MQNRFKEKLLQGQFRDAEEICATMDANRIRDMVLTIAFDTENICVYGFVRYMIEKTRKVSWIELSIDVLVHPLCFIEGAYSLALFHARELLSIERNIGNLEMIIFFYDIPEKLVDEGEAKCVAEEILKMEPDNKVALRV